MEIIRITGRPPGFFGRLKGVLDDLGHGLDDLEGILDDLRSLLDGLSMNSVYYLVNQKPHKTSHWGLDKDTIGLPPGVPLTQTKRNTEQIRLNPYNPSSSGVPPGVPVPLEQVEQAFANADREKSPWLLAFWLWLLAKSKRENTTEHPGYRKASELEQPDLRFRHKLQYSVVKELEYSITWVTLLIYYYSIHYASRIGGQKRQLIW